MAGHTCVGHCEVDRFAEKSYRAMHDVKDSEVFFEDVRSINPSDMPEADIYCFGFPCQAFSICGERRGFDDIRGTIFFEIMRIVKERKPQILFAENVKGLLNHDNGNTFQTIIETMGELGYFVEWQVLNSKYYTAQDRDRVYIVGHLGGEPRRKVFPIIQGEEQADGVQGHESYLANTLMNPSRDTNGTYVLHTHTHTQSSSGSTDFTS